MVVTLGQRYITGEKPIVMLYTYINRNAGTSDSVEIGISTNTTVESG